MLRSASVSIFQYLEKNKFFEWNIQNVALQIWYSSNTTIILNTCWSFYQYFFKFIPTVLTLPGNQITLWECSGRWQW